MESFLLELNSGERDYDGKKQEASHGSLTVWGCRDRGIRSLKAVATGLRLPNEWELHRHPPRMLGQGTRDCFLGAVLKIIKLEER